MQVFKGVSLATLLFMACLIYQCNADNSNCTLENDEFLCTNVTSATSLREAWVGKLLDNSTVYSVHFIDCNFSQIMSYPETVEWFTGYEHITSFTCELCTMDEFPLPFMANMGSEMEAINITGGTIGTIYDAGNTPGLPFQFNLATMLFNDCSWEGDDRFIGKNAFASFEALETLDLSNFTGSLGPVVKEYAFANLNVQKLDLSDAMLGNEFNDTNPLPSSVFYNLNKVTYISIYGNNLVTLAEGTFDLSPMMQPNLNQIRLAGNPWKCDCKLQWLKDFINDNNQVVEFDVPLCASPNKPFNDVDFSCYY